MFIGSTACVGSSILQSAAGSDQLRGTQTTWSFLQFQFSSELPVRTCQARWRAGRGGAAVAEPKVIKRPVKRTRGVKTQLSRHCPPMKTMQPAFILRGHSSEVSSVAFHPSLPLLASTSVTGECRLWVRLLTTVSPSPSRLALMNLVLGARNPGFVRAPLHRSVLAARGGHGGDLFSLSGGRPIVDVRLFDCSVLLRASWLTCTHA